MAGASPGQVVAAKKRLDNTQANHHSLADALFPPTDNDDLLKKFGQDRSAMALNFVSTKPDATAVRYTPNSKIALGKDAHAIADEEGTATGQRIAQEVQAAGGTGAEAVIAGNDARQHFKHYARGQNTEEQMTPRQGRNVDHLTQDRTDPSKNQLDETHGKQLTNGSSNQEQWE